MWIVLYLPLLVLAFAVLAALARDTDARTRRFIHVGLGLLVFAVAAESSSALTHSWGYEDGSTYDTFEVAVEEGAELAGWILVAAALAAHMSWALITAASTGETSELAASSTKRGENQLPQRGDGSSPRPQTVSTYDRGPRCGGGNGRKIGDGVSGGPVFI